MLASSSGSQEMVDLLLDVGADPNLQDKDGSTALMYAAEHGCEKCVKSLVSHRKCNPTMKGKVKHVLTVPAEFSGIATNR